MSKLSYRDLIQTSEGDLLAPLDKVDGRGALYHVVNSGGTYVLLELEPNKNKWEPENLLKHGSDWERHAKFFQSETEAWEAFKRLKGVTIPGDVDGRYKDRL